ncbi:hypothetical protein D047_0890B, partial [Vibrio parahaemolyticus VPTS-2010_2]
TSWMPCMSYHSWLLSIKSS